MTDIATRIQLEVTWNEHAMCRNPAWFAMRSQHRLYAHYRKEFVVWKASSAEPEVLQIYQVADMQMSPVKGLSLVLAPQRGEYRLGRGDILVNHTPIEMPEEDIFIWMGAYTALQFTPESYDKPGSPRSLHVPFMIKTRTNPTKDIQVGATYLHSVSDFREGFPGVGI